MKKVVSISGGKTSAYIAANYDYDDLVFALVRTSDPDLMYKDRKKAAIIEDRIQKPFIGTLEDDVIVDTILDLEQFLGRKIDIVSGLTFEQVIEQKGTWLPSVLRRYCTTWLKIDPIFYWWVEKYNLTPVEMAIGYRANEWRRAKKMYEKLNDLGLSEYKATFEKHTDGRHVGKNKWENIGWRKPYFPLIESRLFKSDIEAYWQGKPVRFAELNNCVGCFHRKAILLKKMSIDHPKKYNWFSKQEGGGQKGIGKKIFLTIKSKTVAFRLICLAKILIWLIAIAAIVDFNKVY